MSKVEDFLTTQEESDIIAAIRIAELNTSGEIRVHLEKTTSKEISERTLELFYSLKMFNTKERNGVLIYIAVEDKKFAIYGDKGIHTKVADNFWDATKNLMQNHFKSNNFKKGIEAVVLSVGEQLKKYFPWSIEDTNELPNEISTS